MNYPSPTIKAITDFIFIGAEAKELSPSDLVIVLGNHIIDIMMGEVAMLFCSGELPCMRQSWVIRQRNFNILEWPTGGQKHCKGCCSDRYVDCISVRELFRIRAVLLY